MIAIATDGFYWPRGGFTGPGVAPPPPCPLPGVAMVLDPDAAVAMELAPLDGSASALEPDDGVVTVPELGSSASAKELKPLSPYATREDDC